MKGQVKKIGVWLLTVTKIYHYLPLFRIPPCPPQFCTQHAKLSPGSSVCAGVQHRFLSPSQTHEHVHAPHLFTPSPTPLDLPLPSPTAVWHPARQTKPSSTNTTLSLFSSSGSGSN